MLDFGPFVGLSRPERGSEGHDCLTLVGLVLTTLSPLLPSDVPGMEELVDVDTAPGRERAAALVAQGRDPWQPVVGPHRPLDVVLMRQRPYHVGVVVGWGMMLHMPDVGSSCIESYIGARYSRRVEGVYRHHKLEVAP